MLSHNDDQFDTLEFKMLLREFLEVLQENGPLASLSSMEAYCQKHGGAITEDGQTYGYIWETERYRFCLRCTPSPFEYQGTCTAMTYGSSKFRKTVRWAR